MIQDPDYSNHWIADSGKVLTKDDIYASDIWLGINDSIENWMEIVPPEYTPADLTPEEYASEIDRIKISMSQWQNRIANVEADYVATRNYISGEMLFVGNALYKAITNIGKGSTIIEGSNVLPTTISDQISLLAE